MQSVRTGHRVFDECYSELVGESPNWIAGLSRFGEALECLRSTVPRSEWRIFGESARCNHPVWGILREDPFTLRAFEKPRGYAGDAKTIDFVYGYAETRSKSRIGKVIQAYTTNLNTAQSVRYRCNILAKRVDETASEKGSPRILALACGHLREAHRAAAVQERRFSEYLAFDQDAKSLAVVEAEFARFGVRTEQGSVVDLDFSRLGNFDLIYAAGLYDYLWQGAAKELTTYAFDMLAPGGKLLIANVHPNIPDAGYLEAVMDWWLVYRTPDELESVADGISCSEIAKKRIFGDPLNNIVFLEVEKA